MPTLVATTFPHTHTLATIGKLVSCCDEITNRRNRHVKEPGRFSVGVAVSQDALGDPCGHAVCTSHHLVGGGGRILWVHIWKARN